MRSVSEGNGHADERWVSSRRAAFALAIGLTLIAAPPRFLNLSDLSFYADEETTAFPALSLAQGNGARMPSGMPYRRALPVTWLATISARLFGIRDEFSYRIPIALLGTLTIPLLFLFGRRFIGTPAALVAALLLAFSEWHLVFSRQARMYGPFLFCFLATIYATWTWARTGRARHFFLAAIFLAASIPLHTLSALLAPLVLIPLVLTNRSRASPIALVALAAVAVACPLAYSKFFVWAASKPWVGSKPPETAETLSQGLGIWGPLGDLPAWRVAMAVVGLALGLWAARRSQPRDESSQGAFAALARYLAAGLAGAFACVGQLYAAATGLLLFLMLHPARRSDIISKAGLPFALAAAVAVVWATGTIVEHGAVRGLKTLLGYPFPYWALLGQQFATTVAIFGGVCVWLALRPPRSEDTGLRACALAAVLVVASVGVASRWGATRFILSAYPFVLLAVAAGLLALMREVGRRTGRWGKELALVAAAAIAVSGAVRGHGIPGAARVVTLKHGEPVNELVHVYSFRPDHEASGEFVRRKRGLQDVLIAEDPLQQRWYAGRVDYWFRSYADSRRFLYEANDGRLRDIYVNSAPLHAESLLDSLVQRTAGSVWFVTSGETAFARQYYLEPWQQAWLDSLESARSPAFIGRDGVTRVYCLNCEATKPR